MPTQLRIDSFSCPFIFNFFLFSSPCQWLAVTSAAADCWSIWSITGAHHCSQETAATLSPLLRLMSTFYPILIHLIFPQPDRGGVKELNERHSSGWWGGGGEGASEAVLSGDVGNTRQLIRSPTPPVNNSIRCDGQRGDRYTRETQIAVGQTFREFAFFLLNETLLVSTVQPRRRSAGSGLDWREEDIGFVIIVLHRKNNNNWQTFSFMTISF